jgi:hypothetical protein
VDGRVVRHLPHPHAGARVGEGTGFGGQCGHELTRNRFSSPPPRSASTRTGRKHAETGLEQRSHGGKAWQKPAGTSIPPPNSAAILIMAHLYSRNRNRYRGRHPCFLVDFGPDPDLDPDSGCHNLNCCAQPAILNMRGLGHRGRGRGRYRNRGRISVGFIDTDTDPDADGLISKIRMAAMQPRKGRA